MQALVRWLAGKAMVFVILVLAVAFFTLLWPNIRSGLAGGTLTADMMSPDEIRAELRSARNQTQERLDRNVANLRTAGESAQARRLAEATAQLAEARRRRREYQGFLDRIRPSKILEEKRLGLRISELKLEIGALEALADENTAANALQAARREALSRSRVPTEGAIRGAQLGCRQASVALAQFERRRPVDRGLRNLFRRERARLEASRQAACGRAERAAAERQAGLDAQRAARSARARYDASRNWSAGTVEDVSKTDISKTVIRNILRNAALLFALILALPLLIRTLFYFVLAPIAERRPTIRLSLDRDSSAPIPLAGPSRTSVSIALREGEELLVRQSFLQSTSETGSKDTRWLLDWAHPLSSIAAGLTFLTRIRGPGSRTTISAVRDPLAEVTILELPKGASCVLHPRALAAVVQRFAEPLAITRHWRLASLHAWLTLQLRYLVFHGPARLVIKGSRGVRVEPAESGRIFGQHQLVGFSTELGYSVRRTETFWPYLLGREQLLKDKVQDGDGVLIVEEAPLTGRGMSGVGRGLEGAFDAGLKAFGL